MGLRVNAAPPLANPQPERTTACGLAQTSSGVPAGRGGRQIAERRAPDDGQKATATASDELRMDE